MEWYNWILFILLFFIVPAAVIFLRKIAVTAHGQSGYNKAKFIGVSIFQTLFYWFLGAFHLCAIFNVLAWTFIFGGISMIIIFYNLANVFINKVGTSKTLNKLGLLQDFIVGLVITVYLIYIIPEEFKSLQTIITAVVAAVYGGLFTLVGVAWTIRKGDEERKEKERKLHVPYLKLVEGILVSEAVYCDIKQPFCFGGEESMSQLENNTFYKVTIGDFIVKNVSSNNILLCGIIMDGELYKFDNKQLLESNNACEIQTTREWGAQFPRPFQKFSICVEDIIGNSYAIECRFKTDMGTAPITIAMNDGKEYYRWNYNYIVKNLALPILIEV